MRKRREDRDVVDEGEHGTKGPGEFDIVDLVSDGDDLLRVREAKALDEECVDVAVEEAVRVDVVPVRTGRELLFELFPRELAERASGCGSLLDRGRRRHVEKVIVVVVAREGVEVAAHSWLVLAIDGAWGESAWGCLVEDTVALHDTSISL